MKKPNNGSPSLGRFLRMREVLTHCSVAYKLHEETSPKTGAVTKSYMACPVKSEGTFRKPA